MAYSLSRYMHTSETRRLMRYMVVGGVSTVVDFTTLVLLKSAGLQTITATALSYVAVFVVSFTMNYRWTYADSRSKQIPLRLSQYCIIGLCGLLLNGGIVALLTSGLFFGMSGGMYLPAELIASSIVFIWNFTANRRWTFSDAR